MHSILWPVILLASLLVGCAGQPTRTDPAPGADPDSFESFSETLEQSMLARDSSLFTSRLDTYQFARRSLTSLGLAAVREKTINNYAKTLGETLESRFRKTFSSIKSARFIRLLPNDTNQPQEAAALIRIEPEDGGINYWKVYLRRENGNISIVDWLNYSLGDTSSHSLGEFALYVGEAIRNPDSEGAEAIKAYLKAAKSNNPQKLLDTYDQLPTGIRQSSMLMHLHIQAASRVSNETYQAVLSELAPLYRKNDRHSLMLVDYYQITEEYDKSHQAIDKLEAQLGADAGLDSLHAAVALNTGDYKRAISHARDGISREPAYTNNYWILLDALVFSENYADAVLVLNILEEGFGYQFDAYQMARLEGYETFAQSAQFKDWRTDTSQ